MQIVIAGKSHPADDEGKRLIQELVQFTDDPEVRHRIVFLPNYDIAMAQQLYPGSDVWLNNPLRPLEACGTSGMKAALNGALNLSHPRRLVGRVVRRRERLGDPRPPTASTTPIGATTSRPTALYDLIEHQVAPRFYDATRTACRSWLASMLHTSPPSARRCSPPGWCASTWSGSTYPPPGGLGDDGRRLRRGARPLGVEGARAGRLAGRLRGARGVGWGSTTPRRWAMCCMRASSSVRWSRRMSRSK